MIPGKTVCVVAQQQRPPEFVASLRDKDTDSCRQDRAIPLEMPLPRLVLPAIPAGPRRFVPIPEWFDPPRPLLPGVQ